jgi:hypothetical protein
MEVKILSETPLRMAGAGGPPRINSKPPCGNKPNDDLLTSETYTEFFSDNPGDALKEFDPSPQPRPNFPITWNPKTGNWNQNKEVSDLLCVAFGCPPSIVGPPMNEDTYNGYRKQAYCKAWLSHAINLPKEQLKKCPNGGVSNSTGGFWSSSTCNACVPQYEVTCHDCKTNSDCGDPKCKVCKASDLKNDLSRPYKKKYCADKNPPCSPTPTDTPTQTPTPQPTSTPCNCGQYVLDNSTDAHALECKNKCCVHDNTGLASPYSNSAWCQGCAQIIPEHPDNSNIWSCPPGWELGLPRDEFGNVNAPPYCLCCQTVCSNGTCQSEEGCPPPPNIGP